MYAWTSFACLQAAAMQAWVCVNVYTPTATFSGNKWKKEEGEEEKRRNRNSKKRVEKEEKGKEEKNKRKSNRLDWWKWIQNGRSRLSLRLKWRRDFNSRLLRANMTFLFAIPLIKSRVARDILPFERIKRNQFSLGQSSHYRVLKKLERFTV